MASALTVKSIEQAKPDPARRREIPDGGLPGLYLIVQPSGAKSWAVRYRVGGKTAKLTLGPYPRLALVEAREQARAAMRQISSGLDPAHERKALRRAHAQPGYKFGAVAQEYVTRHAKVHHRTWAETERILTRMDLAAWRDRDIRQVGRRDVLDVLDALIERGSTVQANRTLTRLKPFFAWAVERGIVETSPIEKLRPPSPETTRDRVLSDIELAAIWKAAAGLGYPFGSAVQLLILTGQRRSEVLEAQWPEFDLSGLFWTIPKERSKTEVAHVVPLSDPVLELLESLPRIGSPARFLFTTTAHTPFFGVSKVFDRLNKRAAEHMPTGETIAPMVPA